MVGILSQHINILFNPHSSKDLQNVVMWPDPLTTKEQNKIINTKF